MQITENSGNLQDKIEKTDNDKINPSHVTNIDHARENTSYSKSNTSRQHKEHKKLAYIIGDSMVKDVDGYLLTGSINSNSIVKVCLFVSANILDI